MNPKMISDDFDVLKPTCVEKPYGVFYAQYDGNYTYFSDEDGDLLFSLWGDHSDGRLAGYLVTVWHDAFEAGAEFGRKSKADEIRTALGVGS